MVEWTQEAKEFLEGYLYQASALIRERGGEPEDVVPDLRAHIMRETQEASGTLITLNELRKTLAQTGTPEQIAASDSPSGMGGPCEAAPLARRLDGPERRALRVNQGLSIALVAAVIFVMVSTVVIVAVLILKKPASVPAGDNKYPFEFNYGHEADASKPEAVLAGDGKYTSEFIDKHEAEYFFDRMAAPEQGYHGFAGLWGVLIKADRVVDEERARILDRALELAADPNRPFAQRYQCCYVASAFEYAPAIPVLRDILADRRNARLQGVAACALGHFESPEATAALERALEEVEDTEVAQWITRALAGEFPRPAMHPPGTGPQAR